MIDIDLIAGARPNFIKISAICHALESYNEEAERVGYEQFQKKGVKNANNSIIEIMCDSLCVSVTMCDCVSSLLALCPFEHASARHSLEAFTIGRLPPSARPTLVQTARVSTGGGVVGCT